MITINVFDNNTIDQIKDLNLRFDFSICKEDKYLFYGNGFLKLYNKNKELYIDFNCNDILNRINPQAKKCSVIQAVEGRNKSKLHILDTTAGLGRDFFTLAARGHKITAIEKDPYIFLLLSDSIKRAKDIPTLGLITKNITLIHNDSCDYISTTNEFFDCIYIDPMFPPRKKSAKVKLDMQSLHELLQNNENSNKSLFDNAYSSAKAKKIVVKRPINGSFLSDRKPTSQLKGKTNRFDVYSL
ncbi:16S rRNA methyltransferase [Allofrancisella frigidaquae]|uniref:Ribosomal RNA small subunit methyltransferase J n=1 Tax=Allofrancisella frigidaquae TaxID=1085644 RepID=A0A6M3HSD2_9GAMM|nr:class I SAM-dependent methyltransferase [Allofrancisella frigidaquae]QIV94049.1 16S rRNA methyltransferase [Allofrancisella frigidaquae]